MKKRPLTTEEKAECKALKAIWDVRKKDLGLTQQAVANAVGEGKTQGAIGHYLSERNALNLKVAAVFAQLLQIQIKDFSPRLHAEMESMGDGQVREAPATYSQPGVVAVTCRALPLSATIHGEAIHNGEDAEREPMYYQASWIKKMGFRPEMLVTREVHGSSMEPALWSGDTVLINCESRKPKHGRAFWVMVEGEAVVKRLLKLHGSWWISSDNESHKVRDIQLESPEQIMGEVVIKSSSHI